MKKQIGYKVVRVSQNGDLLSSSARKRASKKYKIGKWVTAPRWLARKGYHLLYFTTLEEAARFVRYFELILDDISIKIFKCEVKGIKEELPPFCSPDFLAEGKLLSIGDSYGPWPKGTRMAEKIKLTEEVKED